MTAASSADRYPALPWPDGLARIRPALVIFTNGPDTRPTDPEPYRTCEAEIAYRRSL